MKQKVLMVRISLLVIALLAFLLALFSAEINEFFITLNSHNGYSHDVRKLMSQDSTAIFRVLGGLLFLVSRSIAIQSDEQYLIEEFNLY